MNLTSLKLLHFVFVQDSRNSDRRDNFQETHFAFYVYANSQMRGQFRLHGCTDASFTLAHETECQRARIQDGHLSVDGGIAVHHWFDVLVIR